MKKTTKISGWLVMAAAWVVMTMMTMTACSSEGDDILGGNGSEQPKETSGVRVTVSAGISDGEGTTRSAVEMDGTKRVLKFTEGDKLYVWKEVSGASEVAYVAGMLTMVGEPSADGKGATFTGTLQGYDNTGSMCFYYAEGDPLVGTEATLVHAGLTEGAGYFIEPYLQTIDFGDSYAADVETLMTTKLRVTGNYTGSGYTLQADNQPIINCSLSGLEAFTEYDVSLQYPSGGGYYLEGYGIFTTDAYGEGTVAFDANDSGTQDWQIEISLYNSSTTVGTISLGNRELTTKVYNVTRYWTGSEFIKAEPKEIPLTVQALTAGTIVVKYPTDMQYSLNGGEKTTMTGNTTINVSAGDKVQLYGDGTIITSYKYPMITGGTAQAKVYGNIMSLVDKENFATATTLTASNTFYTLFAGYKNLTDASGLLLPATTLADYCYYSMFGGCTSLTAAPKLPAKTLVKNCYDGMFYGCTSLTTAPELPAETLADYCYYEMFSGCTSLTAAPVLPAEKLTSSCYEKMFKGCSNLSSVTCLATVIYSNSTRNWLDGVAASGTFTKAATMTSWTTNSTSGIPSGWTVKDAE